MTEAKFIDGLTVKQPRENAPDFIKASLSFNIPKLIAWAKAQESEWVNADLKESREGKLYVQVNTYKKEAKRDDYRPPAAPQGRGAAEDDFDSDSIPF